MTWAFRGIYSKHKYVERIFADAILGNSLIEDDVSAAAAGIYESIGEYKVKDYVERPHEYVKGKYMHNN